MLRGDIRTDNDIEKTSIDFMSVLTLNSTPRTTQRTEHSSKAKANHKLATQSDHIERFLMFLREQLLQTT